MAGDVFIKLTADEKNAVDAIQRVVAAQQKAESAADDHVKAWKKIGGAADDAGKRFDATKAQSQAAGSSMSAGASSLVGGLAMVTGATAGIGAAIGAIKGVWDTFAAEVRRTSEEIKKSTESMAHAAQAVGKSDQTGQARMWALNVGKEYGLTVPDAAKVYQAAEGNTEIATIAAKNMKMGHSVEQVAAFAGKMNVMDKLGGEKWTAQQNADFLSMPQMSKTEFGDAEGAQIGRAIERGGDKKKILSAYLQAAERGIATKEIGSIADAAFDMKPAEGHLSAATQSEIDAQTQNAKSVHAKQKTLEQTRVAAGLAHKRDALDYETQGLAMEEQIAQSPQWQANKLKSAKTASDMEWKNKELARSNQDLAWDTEGADLSSQRDKITANIDDLKNKKEFSGEESLQNELAAMPQNQRVNAALSQRFAPVFGSKAMQIFGGENFDDQTQNTRFAQDDLIARAGADPEVAGRFEINRAEATTQANNYQQHHAKALKYDMARAAYRATTSISDELWKDDAGKKKIDRAEALGTRLEKINPALNAEANRRFYDSLDYMLGGQHLAVIRGQGAAQEKATADANRVQTVRILSDKNQVSVPNSASAKQIEGR